MKAQTAKRKHITRESGMTWDNAQVQVLKSINEGRSIIRNNDLVRDQYTSLAAASPEMTVNGRVWKF